MSVTSARPAARPRLRARASRLHVAGLAAGAAVAGLLIGTVFHAQQVRVQKPVQVSGAGVRLLAPAGWAKGDAVTLPGFERFVWLRDSGHRLRASAALLPAASPTLLPKPLAAGAPEPQTVRLQSGSVVWRYRMTRPGGSPALLYVAPTTGGVATVACLGATATARCDALASALDVPGTRRLELDGRAAFFSALPRVVTALRGTRARGLATLGNATNPTAQALTADDLAAAHRSAASQLRPLSRDERTDVAVERLRETAKAYTALGEAARDRLPGPYADAAAGVTSADAALRHSLAKVAAAADDATLPAGRP